MEQEKVDGQLITYTKLAVRERERVLGITITTNIVAKDLVKADQRKLAKQGMTNNLIIFNL